MPDGFNGTVTLSDGSELPIKSWSFAPFSGTLAEPTTPVDRLMDECRAVVAENHRQMMARQDAYWRTYAKS